MYSTRPRPEEARVEIATLGIEPRLILRPVDQDRRTWDVCLEIPELSQLLLKFPKMREVLTQSRCTVTGSSGRPLARGQCLFGSQRVALVRWPRHDEVLLKFDKRDLHLEALLRTECLLRPGPIWLFHITSDGLAYEVRSLRIRPGENYILVRAGTLIDADVPAVALACEGVKAILLELPDALDANWEITLQQLGLKHARAIDVWPAGLTPALWDSEGHGEWLASERPCLGVRADHSVNAIVVTVGSSLDSPLLLDNIHPGSISFVELPRLPVGLHSIRFSTRRTGFAAADPVGELEVLMRVRESRPWSQSGGAKGPLLARIEPISPTLEELWENRANIAFQGPTGRQLRCTASLVDSVSDQVAIVRMLPPLTLPVDAPTWMRHFTRHFRNERNAATAYDSAKACELRFTSDELGTFTLRCERELTPLRWVLRQRSVGNDLRFLNDSGDTIPITIGRRTFERPDKEEALEVAEIYKLPPSGGMYIARLSGRIAAIIASPIVQGLTQLGCNPTVEYSLEAKVSLPKIWEDAELWSAAKLSGNVFGMARLREVLLAIQKHVIRTLCGNDWLRTEVAYCQGTSSEAHLLRAIWVANYEAEIAERLRRSYPELNVFDRAARVHEMVKIAKFLEGPDSQIHDTAFEWLAEFALRVASDPTEVKTWAGNRLEEGIGYLLRFPTYMRAARCMVIAIDQQLNESDSTSALYASWRWR